jgi:hypothetical protein
MRKRIGRETLSVLSVVAGLVFVGTEIRENSRAARAAAYQEIGIATADLWTAFTDKPQLALAISLGTADSTFSAPMDAEMLAMVSSHTIRSWRIWETVFLQVEQGLLPPGALERFGWGGPAWPTPFDECLWKSQIGRQVMSPEFTAYGESLGEWGTVDCVRWEERRQAAFRAFVAGG